MSLAEVRALPTDPVALKAKLENRDNVVVTAVRRRAAVVRRHAARREGRALQRAQEPVGREADPERHRPARADRRRRAVR